MIKKHIHLRLEELQEERGISQTKLCKDLNIQWKIYKKYAHDEFLHIDANLIIKLCDYLNCGISDLLEIKEKEDDTLKESEPSEIKKKMEGTEEDTLRVIRRHTNQTGPA